jgi:uncharacterized protein YlxP (DUF503 family)
VDQQDLWNRAVLGVACVALDARAARETLDSVLRFAEEHNGSVISDYSIEVL